MNFLEYINEEIKTLDDFDFTTKNGIMKWLVHTQIPGTVNDNLEVLGGNVTIRNLYSTLNHTREPSSSGKLSTKISLPVKFKDADSFFAKGLFLTSLKNFPDTVKNDCLISNNRLLNCVDGPKEVGKTFDVSGNRLRNTKGFPKKIGVSLIFDQNDTIHNLKDIHHDINYVHKVIQIPATVESHVLGLLLIGGNNEVIFNPVRAKGKLTLKEIQDRWATIKIINKHRMNDKDVLECQEELISAGYKDFAKL